MQKIFLAMFVVFLVFSAFVVLHTNKYFDIEITYLNQLSKMGSLVGKLQEKYRQVIHDDDILIDTNTTESSLTELDYIKRGEEYIRNLPPANYLLGNSKNGPKFLGNNSCATFPHIFKLKFDNVIWQMQEQSNWTFYLLGAFWDIRERNKDAPSIRIIGMMDRMGENITTNYCQVWFENQKAPLITEITHYRYLWVKKWGNYKDGELQPYLMTCPMPEDYSGPVPTSVSVVPSPCTHATNNLRVLFDKPEKQEKFAVCVKGMDFLHPDWSTRLVEWIELLHILGVSKIYIYDLAVHPNVQKVYKYYTEQGKIEVLPLTHPGDLPNEPNIRHAYLKRKMTVKRQHELIPYNDCLYRNMYKYEYISLLDIDEVIIPHNGASTWTELANILEKQSAYLKAPNTSFFVFANVMFSPDDITYSKKERQNIPTYLHMLQHTNRSSKDAGRGSGIKCFHRPEFVLSLHNHFPTECLGTCTRVYVDHSDGFLHHYRTKSAGGIVKKKNQTLSYIIDETLWNWKTELIIRSNTALADMGFVS